MLPDQRLTGTRELPPQVIVAVNLNDFCGEPGGILGHKRTSCEIFDSFCSSRSRHDRQANGKTFHDFAIETRPVAQWRDEHPRFVEKALETLHPSSYVHLRGSEPL